MPFQKGRTKTGGRKPKSGSTIQVAQKILTQKQQEIAVANAKLDAMKEELASKVLAEFQRIAFYDPRKILTWGKDGVRLIDSAKLAPEEAAVVSEVSETRTETGGSLRIKMCSKLDALDRLARHCGLYAAENEQRRSPVTVIMIDEPTRLHSSQAVTVEMQP